MSLRDGAATMDILDRKKAESAIGSLPALLFSTFIAISLGWSISMTLVEEGPVNAQYHLPNFIFQDNFIAHEDAFVAEQLAVLSMPTKRLTVVQTKPKVAHSQQQKRHRVFRTKRNLRSLELYASANQIDISI